MEKEKSLVDLIDIATDKTIKGFKWLGKMVRGKNSVDTIKIFTKIIITFLILWFLSVPFDLLKEIGTLIIYTIGSTFRSVLSTSLSIILEVSYFTLCLVVLFNVFSSILKDKELNILEENRRKDAKLKKQIFNPIIDIIKACIYILTIPFVFLIISALILFGMNLYLFVNGYHFISLFLICIGIVIMVGSALSVILNIVKGVSK